MAINYALATKGATATGNSYDAGHPLSAILNGYRTAKVAASGLSWGAGGGYSSADPIGQQDTLEIVFGQSRTINEIDCITLPDNFDVETQPILTDTFSSYGVTAFDVDYWNGSAWVNIASVTGNDKVWRQFTFSPITTTKIRIVSKTYVDGQYARWVAIEAWNTALVASFIKSTAAGAPPLTVDFTDTSTSTPISWLWDFGDGNTSTEQNPSHTYTSAGIYNVTLQATNAIGSNTTSAQMITVSTSVSRVNFARTVLGVTATGNGSSGYAVSAVINGYRTAKVAAFELAWGAGGGYSTDSLTGSDTVILNFGQSKTIDEIDCITLPDNFDVETQPTLTDTFSAYGVTDFDVDYWNGSAWVNIASVTGNDKVWRKFSFSAVTTTKIRVIAFAYLAGNARWVAIEAWGTVQAQGPSSALRVTTAAQLQPGAAGVDYSQQINVTGGVPPFAFLLSGESPTTIGQHFETDFANLTDFTQTGGGTGIWSPSQSAPSFVSFDPSNITFNATPSSSDAGGVREGHLLINEDGLFMLFYGAGNGVSGNAGQPWRIHLATSPDGVTWTRHGALSMGLSKTNNSSDGNWAATDMLWCEQRDGLYILHRLITSNIIGGAVPDEPYLSDIWTATDPFGTWTFVRQVYTLGASGQFDDFGAYEGSVVYSAEDNLYYHFYSAKNSNSQWHIGIASSETPSGAITKLGQLLPNDRKGQTENFKYLGKFGGKHYAVCNQVNKEAGLTDKNSLFVSDYLTDWSNAIRYDFQRISPMDGAGAIGIPSPVYGVNGQVLTGASGAISFCYDSDPSDTGSGKHNGRHLKFGSLERSGTSAFVAAAAVASTEEHRLVKQIAYADFTAEFALEITAVNSSGSNKGVFFEFRASSDGATGFRVLVEQNGKLSLWQKLAGESIYTKQTAASVDPSGLTQNATVSASPVFTQHRIKIESRGGIITAYLNGELQITITDTNLDAANNFVGFCSAGADAQIRLLTIRSGTSVSVAASSGASLVVYGAGGCDAREKITSFGEEGAATINEAHYPIAAFLDGSTRKPGFAIYAGDEVNLSADSAFPGTISSSGLVSYPNPQVGNYSFFASVTDADDIITQKPFSLTIKPTVTIRLEWEASTDPLLGVAGYEIQRATDSDFTDNLVTISIIGGYTIRYDDENRIVGLPLFYRIRAKNNANFYSRYSPVVSIMPSD